MVYKPFFTEDEYQTLLARGSNDDENKDDAPLVKLYMTCTNCIWLICELNPEQPDIAFGLCDLGVGFSELGFVSLGELFDAQEMFYHLKRDESFDGQYPISAYARAARAAGGIVSDPEFVKQHIVKLTP